MSDFPPIEELVARLQDALDEIDWMDRKPRPVLRPPATAEAIAAFEKKVGRALPPSYRSFIELHNGMEGADQYDWAIRGVTPVKKGESFDDVQSGHVYAFSQKDANHPVVRDLKRGFLAGSDFDYQVVYFDPTTFDQEEPKLRRVGLDAPYDQYPLFDDFQHFLAFIVSIYEDLVDMQNDAGTEDALAEEEALLRELTALLGGGGDIGPSKAGPHAIPDEPEPEPEPVKPPELSPEMVKAARLCELTLEKLVDGELVELIPAPGGREALEDYMMKKLLRSSSPEDAMENWIYALSKAREVEELYGTDEQLKAVMEQAFVELEKEY